jgi:rod shape-determining protein MreB
MAKSDPTSKSPVKSSPPLCRDLALDLGTTNSLLAARGRGILLREPSVVAAEGKSGKLLCAGQTARQMLGRTPGDLVALRPLARGVITDGATTEAMLRAFLKKACPGHLLKPRLLIGVPTGISQVEERALVEAALGAGARRVYLMEEPLAAALGAGVDIQGPQGCLVVDIGGGTTDVAVVALGGVVASVCLPVAGDTFDRALVRAVRQEHHLLLGRRTAEEVKQAIGQVDREPQEEDPSLSVKGRCLATGLPREITLTASQTTAALLPPAEEIAEAVQSLLERTPPELAADVAATGILLTGGGSLLRGLDRLLSQRTGLPARLAPSPLESVALGLEKTLPTLSKRRPGPLDLAKRRWAGDSGTP